MKGHREALTLFITEQRLLPPSRRHLRLLCGCQALKVSYERYSHGWRARYLELLTEGRCAVTHHQQTPRGVIPTFWPVRLSKKLLDLNTKPPTDQPQPTCSLR